MKKTKSEEPVKLEANTWQIALVSAVILFIVYLLVNCDPIYSFIKYQIPHENNRIVSIGLIISAILFLCIGLIHHCVCPVKEKRRQTNNMSPFAVIDR